MGLLAVFMMLECFTAGSEGVTEMFFGDIDADSDGQVTSEEVGLYSVPLDCHSRSSKVEDHFDIMHEGDHTSDKLREMIDAIDTDKSGPASRSSARVYYCACRWN